MTTFFLFIFLALLTVGHALHHGTADNDTTILTKLTLEDIFNFPDLDKRKPGFGPFKRKKKKHGVIGVPLVLELTLDYPYYPEWYIQVPLVASHRLEFQIDTYGVWSVVSPPTSNFFDAKKPDRKSNLQRPGRSFSGVPTLTGHADRSRITIGSGVTWEGHLLKLDGHVLRLRHGIFGLSLADSRVEEEMHSLPNLLKNFHSQVFALSLSEPYSGLRIGGWNNYFQHLEWHKVVKTSGPHQPWQIGKVRIYVDNEEIVPENTEHAEHTGTTDAVPKFTTAFDSSTPYIYGPSEEVRKIMQAVANARHRNRDPVVYFQWEDKEKWPAISHVDLLRFLFKKSINPSMKGWVLGTEFMYPYKIAFAVNHNGAPHVGITPGLGYHHKPVSPQDLSSGPLPLYDGRRLYPHNP